MLSSLPDKHLAIRRAVICVQVEICGCARGPLQRERMPYKEDQERESLKSPVLCYIHDF